MKKPLKTIIIPQLFLLVFMIGCNNSPKNVSGTIFKKEFELGVNQTMKQSRYLGETNHIFYLSHKTRSIISGAWKEEIWYAKSEDLEPGFMNKLREFKKNKETKLINATKKGDLETVKTYLKEGIDINTRDSDNGYSILHWAAEKGQKKIV